MAGLLDAFNDPGFQRGLMMMAASRPMSEQQRAGLLSWVDNQEQAKLQREYMGLQMEGKKADIEKNRLATQRMTEGQQFMSGLMQRGQPSAEALGRLGMEGGADFSGPVSPQAQQTASQLSNPAPWTSQMTLDDVARGEMYGTNLLPIYNAAKQGVTFRPGEVTQLPDGRIVSIQKDGMVNALDGGVREAPGAALANARFKGMETGAQEQAKINPALAIDQGRARIAAQHELVAVPMPDGTTQMMPRSQALAATGGMAGQAPVGFGSTQSPANAAYATDAAKSAQKQFQDIQSAGMKAPGMMAKLDQLGQLLGDHDGSKLSPTGLQLSQMANSLGFKIDKNLGNKEAAQAISQEMALALRSTADGGGMPGALSDKDRDFLVSMVPGLTQSAEGRKVLIEAQKAVYQRQVEVSKMARQWQQRYGRIDSANPITGKTFYDNLQDWSERNRLFSE